MEGSKISQKRIAIQIAASKIPPAVRVSEICNKYLNIGKLTNYVLAEGQSNLSPE